MAYLTVCLPTRNRQAYCIKTIEALAEAHGDDFEILVADNSDDPKPLAEFFANTLKDGRFRLIPPAGRVLSMVDNWERLMEQAAGRWVTFIGDDDYIDTRVTGLIRRLEISHRGVDSINWDCMSFQWPDNRPAPTLARIPVTSAIGVRDKGILSDRLFRWSEGQRRPSVGVGIYHGVVRKSLMDSIKDTYGGRYFEHPIVDWDNTCKVVRQAGKLVHCERPFSVLGACFASNSAVSQSREVLMERLDIFERESAGNIGLYQPDFPFAIIDDGSSLCLSIATLTAWFCHAYDIDLTGFGANFASAAMDECKYSYTLDEYVAKVRCFERGFALWEGGRWAGLFKPAPFTAPKTVNQLSGLADDTLHIREAGIRPTTPGEFYRFAENAILPVDAVINGTRVFAS